MYLSYFVDSWNEAKRHIIKTKEDQDVIRGSSKKHSTQEATFSSLNKNENEDANEDNKKMWAEIHALMPFSTYDIRLYAENKIGISDHTQPIVRIRTQEEAPEGTPTSVKAISNSSQTLVITWKVGNYFLFGRSSNCKLPKKVFTPINLIYV